MWRAGARALRRAALQRPVPAPSRLRCVDGAALHGVQRAIAVARRGFATADDAAAAASVSSAAAASTAAAAAASSTADAAPAPTNPPALFRSRARTAASRMQLQPQPSAQPHLQPQPSQQPQRATVVVGEVDPHVHARSDVDTAVVPAHTADAPAAAASASASATTDVFVDGGATVVSDGGAGDLHLEAAQTWARAERLLTSSVVAERKAGRDLFDLMVKGRGPVSDAQWRVLFTHLADVSHVNALYRYLEELAASGDGGVLSLHTFNIAMNAFGAAGQQRRAAWLAEYMRHCQVMADEHTIAGLMRADAWHVDAAGVTRWFDYMLELGITPTRVSYNVLIKTLARAGDVDNTFRFYQRMKAANVAPDHYTFGTLFYCCKQSGRYREVGDLYRDMERAGIPLDVYMATSLVSLFGARGDLDGVVRWFERAVSAARKHPDTLRPPNRVLYGAVLQAFARAKDPEGVFTFYKRMRLANWRPDLTTVQQMVRPWTWGNAPPPSDPGAVALFAAAKAVLARLPQVHSGTRTAEREREQHHMGTELTERQRDELKHFVLVLSNWVAQRRADSKQMQREADAKLAAAAEASAAAADAEVERRKAQAARDREASLSVTQQRARAATSAADAVAASELEAELQQHVRDVQHAMFPDPVAALALGAGDSDGRSTSADAAEEKPRSRRARPTRR